MFSFPTHCVILSALLTMRVAEYRKLWPDAGAYLDTVKLSGEKGLLDLSLLQQDKYDEAMIEVDQQPVGGRGSKDRCRQHGSAVRCHYGKGRH